MLNPFSVFSFRRPGSWVMLLLTTALLVLQPSTISHAAAVDGEVWWADNYHDSRDPLYRTPGGSAPANTDVTLRLRTAASDLTLAQVRTWNTAMGAGSILNMSKVASNGTYDWWSITLNTGTTANILYYRFILIDGIDVDFYEDDDRFWGGVGQMYDGGIDNTSPDRSWALTVYDPDFSTPGWVKNAIFYQVFVDRFSDGSAANNNPAGEFFYGEAGSSIVRSNSADWNTILCDPREVASPCTLKYSQNFYGGDLQGLQDKLPYLKDLGITALYLNPIFESPSNHKYDTSDFSVVDDNFGGDAAFFSLITAAHAEGIEVVLDGVFNHASSMSPYFDRYSLHGSIGACESLASPYVSMFQFFNDTVSPTCSDNRDYPYWFGIFDSLAVLENNGTAARDAIWGAGITHPSGKTEAIAKYWVQAGVDGWRLDVAPEIDHGMFDSGNDYWENFRAAVHSANPDAYIVGEEWGVSVNWTSGGEQGAVISSNPGEWDATMNYQQSAALLSLWRDTALNAENDFNSGSSAGLLSPYEPSQFVERYLNLKERYSPEAFAAMMNLLGSHDTQRALWLLDHGHPASPSAGFRYPISPSHDWTDALQRLHGVALMQFTLPGAPQVYYGDEIGLVGPSTFDGSTWQDDPYNRMPYPWLDETGVPYYAHLQVQATQDANFAYYKLLADTRNAHAALRTGDIEFLLIDDANNHLGYLRQVADGSDSVVVLVNRGASATLAVNLLGKVAIGTVFDDATTPGLEAFTVDGSGTLQAFVGANQGAILVPTTALPIAPSAPSALSATVNGLNIDLSWGSATGADSYNVYRSLLSGGGYSLLSNVVTTTFSDTTAAPGTVYYYLVRSRDDVNGLLSAPSNEDSAQTQYDLATAYRNVQYPSFLNHTISTESPTDNVYAQLYIGGVTDVQTTPVAGVSAQLGFGPVGSNPIVDDSDWVWTAMAPNPSYDFTANRDEFQGAMLPGAVGAFVYTVRYSADGGVSWYFATDYSEGSEDSVNCPDTDTVPSAPMASCTLNVVASSDSTPPGAPTLAKDFDTSSEVSISWSGATDNVAVGRYRVYRSENAGVDYDLIAELDDAVQSYVDADIAGGASYLYVVTTVDTSYNESVDSNAVTAVAENSPVDVTFTVTVPDFTTSASAIQVIGGAPELTNWGLGVDMSPTANPFEFEVTIEFSEGDSFEFKYRRDGTWSKVEKELNGYTEIVNRAFTVGHAEDGPFSISSTVLNWSDVLVTATDPEGDSSAVPVDSDIAVRFNKTINTSSTFGISDEFGNPVSGTFEVVNTSPPTLTLNPAANLCQDNTYSVNVAGLASATGDGSQLEPYNFNFTTAGNPVDVTFRVTVPGFTPAGDVVYLSGNDPALGNNSPSSGVPLTFDEGEGVWTATVALKECQPVTVFAHRGSASTVETDSAAGTAITTHSLTVSDSGSNAMSVDLTVGHWLDPIVVSVSPPDGSTGVPISTAVDVQFSKSVNSGTEFTVEDTGSNLVSGAFSYSAATRTVSFTPTAPLAFATTYTVSVSGVVGGDASIQEDASVTDFATTPRTVDVTWTLTVPTFTPAGTIYISGNHPVLGSGVLDAVAMTNSGPGEFTFTGSVLESTAIAYTYSRGNANTQAALPDGETLFTSNLTVDGQGDFAQTVSDAVDNWIDPIVVTTLPADNAAMQAVDTAVSVTFSKPINSGSTFTVTDSDSAVKTGSFSYAALTHTLTFTPSPEFRFADTITVVVTGIAGAVTGTQVDPVSFDFKTEYLELLDNGGFEESDVRGLTPWIVTNGTGDKVLCNPRPVAVPVVSGVCAFRFKGSVTEASVLSQVVNVTGVPFVLGDEVILGAYHSNLTVSKIKTILEIRYADAETALIKLKGIPTSGYQYFASPTVVLDSANVTRIRVKFKHTSTTGKAWIDDVTLMLRQGDARAIPESNQPSPLPGIAGGWRGN
ncbi:MAG: Ig-like domain-containing protein [Chloroflexi bacterium]|nr:Ig-like domain-containing protein [Chloroflexota bacterium]